MILLMKSMENGEKIKYLEYLFHNHFNSKPIKNMILATKNYTEEYMDKDLIKEETEIMKFPYENGYSVRKKWNE